MFRLGFCLLALATPAAAQDFICHGTAPVWSMSITGNEAIFDYERKNTFEIPETAIAEGREWPRAMPLISEFDTAIALLDLDSCESGPIKAHVLTQRGQTPLLLTGCCERTE